MIGTLIEIMMRRNVMIAIGIFLLILLALAMWVYFGWG